MGLIGKISGIHQKVQFIQQDKTVISIDATIQENHNRESPPTEFEIENGQTISDHIVVKPFSLEIHGIISDTPIGGLGGLIGEALTTVAAVKLPSPVGVVGVGAGVALINALAGGKRPSVNAYEQLLQLQESRQPFDVLTTLKRYPSMWIKSISVPRDASTGQILMFQIQLVQLLIVSPLTVNIQIFQNSDLSADEINKGKQEGTSAALQAFQKQEASALGLVGAQ